MNRLQYETSPYLLQHAANPVDWYAWGNEARERAQREDKPMLLSIGYATCHWCHVMERESFENHRVAEYMNANFVCVKLDREERPDLDAIFMDAVQALGVSGGWPLNCFLLPDGKPFFGGTYFPPTAMYGRLSWMDLLQRITHLYTHRREDLTDNANKLLAGIVRAENSLQTARTATETSGEHPTQQGYTFADAFNTYQNLRETFDTACGGFGGAHSAPKFPATFSLRWLMAYHHFTGEAAALRHVAFSLDSMLRGGIYDAVGGGFARYTVDAEWKIPHFEKMLYDNALLITTLAEAYQITGYERYRIALVETLRYVDREMTASNGLFYAAQDADSEGTEGLFYTWEYTEIVDLLHTCPHRTTDEVAAFVEFYSITEAGNWEHRNILYSATTLEDYAQTLSTRRTDAPTLEGLRTAFDAFKAHLYTHREKRVKPLRDEKHILAWNALMLTAYTKAALALSDTSYINAAERTAAAIETHLCDPQNGVLWHSYTQGRVSGVALLDGYAFYTESLLALYSATANERYLSQALATTAAIFANFDTHAATTDDNTAPTLFYFAPHTQTDLIIRKTDTFDSATPSANATMACNLLRLYHLTGNESYHTRGRMMCESLRKAAVQFPASFGKWAEAAWLLEVPPTEVAIVGTGFVEVSRALQLGYLPNSIIVASDDPSPNESKMPLLPLLEGKSGTNGSARIYVCENFACHPPVTTVEEARAMLVRGA